MIPGIELTIGREAVVVVASRALDVVSSAMVGGGVARARAIVNLHVTKHFDAPGEADQLLSRYALDRRGRHCRDRYRPTDAVWRTRERSWLARGERGALGARGCRAAVARSEPPMKRWLWLLSVPISVGLHVMALAAVVWMLPDGVLS